MIEAKSFLFVFAFQQVCALDCQRRDDCYSFQFNEAKGTCRLGGFYDHRFTGDPDGVTVFIHIAGIDM